MTLDLATEIKIYSQFDNCAITQQQLTSMLAKIALSSNQKDLSVAISQLTNGITNITCNIKEIISFNNLHQINSDNLQKVLVNLKPWRKGKFNFQNINVDSEWDSYLKWQRLKNHLNFNNKTVLDIGAANGYFSLQILNHNPKFVLGLDRTINYYLQYFLLAKLIRSSNINNKNKFAMLPLTFENYIKSTTYKFDIILSMGVFYHSKSPIEHLLNIKNRLVRGGKLLLETLYIDGDENTLLIPSARYAKMKNVWLIPSIAMLKTLLHRCNFSDIKIIDTSTTDNLEQRATKWSSEKSLEDFLDAKNSDLTSEGYPRPKRVIITATKKCKAK